MLYEIFAHTLACCFSANCTGCLASLDHTSKNYLPVLLDGHVSDKFNNPW